MLDSKLSHLFNRLMTKSVRFVLNLFLFSKDWYWTLHNQVKTFWVREHYLIHKSRTYFVISKISHAKIHDLFCGVSGFLVRESSRRQGWGFSQWLIEGHLSCGGFSQDSEWLGRQGDEDWQEAGGRELVHKHGFWKALPQNLRKKLCHLWLHGWTWRALY